MKEEKIRIGELAKLVGIAPETIRYYERKNIIAPKRHHDNQYRSFSEDDIYAINRIRSYLHYEFTLKEIEEMLFAPNIETTQLNLMLKASELESRIAKELELLNSIHQRLLHIQTVLTHQNKIVQKKSEDFYYIKIMDGGKKRIKMKNCDTISWASKLHFSYPISIVNPKSYRDGKHQLVTAGLAVTVAELEKTKTTIPEDLHFVKSRPVLYTTGIYREDQPPDSIYAVFRKYLEEFSVEIEDELYMKIIATQQENGVNIHYMEMWIPIKEN